MAGGADTLSGETEAVPYRGVRSMTGGADTLSAETEAVPYRGVRSMAGGVDALSAETEAAPNMGVRSMTGGADTLSAESAAKRKRCLHGHPLDGWRRRHAQRRNGSGAQQGRPLDGGRRRHAQRRISGETEAVPYRGVRSEAGGADTLSGESAAKRKRCPTGAFAR